MIIDNSSSSLKALIDSNTELQSLLQNIEAENRLILSKYTHELRNPLTLIRSTIQLIEQQHPEVKEFKYWKQLITDIDDTVNIMNELSLYNHCDQLSLSNTDLVELIQSTIESLNPLAVNYNVTIQFEANINNQQLNSFACDNIKLKEVITNLIKNAIEAATIESVIMVDLSVPQISNTLTGQYVHITVTNFGCPIPNDLLTHIFEPFVTSKSNGTGLGLSVSQKIAQLHGGQLSVSQTDSAVTFTLQLPMYVSADVI